VDEMKKPPHIHLYDLPGVKTLAVQELADYVRDTVQGGRVELRREFFQHHMAGQDGMADSVAEGLARCKVRDIQDPKPAFEPLPAEVDYEKRFLRQAGSKPTGILYDGVKLLHILWELIPHTERGLSHVHIVLTNQLVGTCDPSDRRYHVRVGVYGVPSVISTTGVVEGPAKPREFYLLKQQYAAMGMDGDLLKLKDQFEGTFIDYDDERLTEVLKGYVMQAVLYHLTGNPFCEDRHCRLYNAHWQGEMIHAQLESPYEFCQIHRRLLSDCRD